LSTLSDVFRRQWAAHDVRIRHDGIKRLHHPEVGDLELVYQSLDLPTSTRAVHDLTVYTAEPGTPSEDRLKLLASWAATRTELQTLRAPTRGVASQRCPGRDSRRPASTYGTAHSRLSPPAAEANDSANVETASRTSALV
jgi:hypothetical protein